MSVFNRIAGTEEPKIPVWFIISDCMKVVDSRMTFPQFAAEYSLTQLEQAEMGEYLTAVGTILTAEIANRTALGSSAERDARSAVETLLRTSLLQIEQHKMTLAEFRALLGLS